jgi:hypothetical protein
MLRQAPRAFAAGVVSTGTTAQGAGAVFQDSGSRFDSDAAATVVRSGTEILECLDIVQKLMRLLSRGNAEA